VRLTGFEGRTAVVTGAAGGIGRAIVAALAGAGAHVVATDTEAGIAAIRPDDPSRDEARWEPLDIRDAAAAAALIERAEERSGPVTLGVHAAGVLVMGPVLSMPAADWQRLSEINIGGTLTMLSVLGRAMRRHRRGAIVVVGSNAGGVPRLEIGAYGASKAAAAMLTRCAGLELAPHGVRCNLVAPGSTLTPMLTGMWADPQAGEAAAVAGDAGRFRTGIPLGKLAAPEDIAQAVMYLLSDQAGHVTMADLYVDGGATLRA